jgi:hypothetical protein
MRETAVVFSKRQPADLALFFVFIVTMQPISCPRHPMPPPRCVFCSKSQQRSTRKFRRATKEERLAAACGRAHFGAQQLSVARFCCHVHSITSSLAQCWRIGNAVWNSAFFEQALVSLELQEQRADVEQYYRAGRAAAAAVATLPMSSPADDAAQPAPSEQTSSPPFARSIPLAPADRDVTIHNDDVCNLCKTWGDLVCCERCPHSYHEQCLSARWAGAKDMMDRLADDDVLTCSLLRLQCVARKSPILRPSKAPPAPMAAPALSHKPKLPMPLAAPLRSVAQLTAGNVGAVIHQPFSRAGCLMAPVAGAKRNHDGVDGSYTTAQSWISGQSFCIRIDRISNSNRSYLVKCFYYACAWKAEVCVLQHLAVNMPPAALDLYVRRMEPITLYPNENIKLRGAFDGQYPRFAKKLHPDSVEDGTQRDTDALRMLQQQRLIFRYYSFTLADAIDDRQRARRCQLQRAYGTRTAEDAFPLRTELESTLLLIAFVLHCFRGLHSHHAAGVLLGDIKPDNLFTTAGNELQPVFGDHGLAFVGTGYRLEPGQKYGTAGYRAPEAEPLVDDTYYTAASDIFSLASSLIDVLCGKQLNNSASRRLECEFHKQQPQPRWLHDAHPACARVPSWLLDLLLSMLEDDPCRRSTLADAIAACEQRLC